MTKIEYPTEVQKNIDKMWAWFLNIDKMWAWFLIGVLIGAALLWLVELYIREAA